MRWRDIANKAAQTYTEIADAFNDSAGHGQSQDYGASVPPSPGRATTPATAPGPKASALPATDSEGMTSASYPLDTNASVTLDGSGNGTISLGPQIVREHWQPGSATVSVGTNTNEASCSLYLGSTIVSGTLLAQTSKGSTGATAPLSGDMPTGYLIWAVWKGGDPGSQATLRVSGSRSIGAPTA